MLVATLRLLRQNALRIGVVLGTFALVVALIFVQQMREAFAEQDFQAARAQVLAAQTNAITVGLDAAEYSDLQRQELTTSTAAPPATSAPFNQDRIAFFNRAASQEVQIKDQLDQRVQKLVAETRDAAQAAVTQLSDQMQKAKQAGVDDQLLVQFDGLPSKAQIEVDAATTVSAYRAVSAELKAPVSKLALLIADQQASNKLVAQYVAQ
ncbi:MAG TPA: hypothetical protein VN834_03170, partial [Candidatus Acidoferrum sp.]|nr:hypothetical protein [Candidatus Acidoferrum sp.]